MYVFGGMQRGVTSLTFCGRWTTAVSDVTNPRVVSTDKMPRFQGILALNNSCRIGSSYISIWNFFQIGTSFCCNDRSTIQWMDYYYCCTLYFTSCEGKFIISHEISLLKRFQLSHVSAFLMKWNVPPVTKIVTHQNHWGPTQFITAINCNFVPRKYRNFSH